MMEISTISTVAASSNEEINNITTPDTRWGLGDQDRDNDSPLSGLTDLITKFAAVLIGIAGLFLVLVLLIVPYEVCFKKKIQQFLRRHKYKDRGQRQSSDNNTITCDVSQDETNIDGGRNGDLDSRGGTKIDVRPVLK
ncbi:unnamed protein product [Owenia fusiformis]|uniref:Uncharacterized protein n=1 Tax=Owenia fusiformis TaxID=6347 RepID=A0A8J1UFG5_OWEFU|nr:unnamed protein product [Owenia fusiformis]